MEDQKETKITTGIVITPSIHTWLKNRAIKRNTSVSQIVLIAVMDYIEKIDKQEQSNE